MQSGKRFELRGGKEGLGYTVDGKLYSTQAEICLRFGRSQAWAARRFKALGKRDVTSSELLNYKGSGEPLSEGVKKAAEARGVKIRVEGFEGEYLYSQLPALFPHLSGKTDQYFRNRHRSAGCPSPCPTEVFESVHPVACANKRGRTSWHNKRTTDDLPHITLGDLAHLSGKENTGAARNHTDEYCSFHPGACLGNVGQVRIALPRATSNTPITPGNRCLPVTSLGRQSRPWPSVATC